MNRLSRSERIQLLIVAAVLLIIVMRVDQVVSFLARIVGVIKPFLYGGAIAFVLNRPYKLFNRYLTKFKPLSEAVKNTLALLLTYAAFVLVIIAVVGFVLPQFVESMQLLINQSESYADNIAQLMNGVDQWLSSIDFSDVNVNNMITELPRVIGEYLSSAVPNIFNIASNIFGVMTLVVLSLILSTYILLNKTALKKVALTLAETYLPEHIADRAIEIADIINTTFSSFIIGQLIEAFILGVIFFVGMLLFRFEYALFISVIVGVTALIPYVGYILGLLASTLLLLMVNPMQAVWFVVFFVVVQQIENNFIYPRVVGDSVGLPAIAVISATILFGGLFGFVGVLLGIPTFSVIYQLIVRDVTRRRSL